MLLARQGSFLRGRCRPPGLWGPPEWQEGCPRLVDERREGRDGRESSHHNGPSFGNSSNRPGPGSSMWFFPTGRPRPPHPLRRATGRRAHTPDGDLPWVGSQTDHRDRDRYEAVRRIAGFRVRFSKLPSWRARDKRAGPSPAPRGRDSASPPKTKYRVQVHPSSPVGRWPQGSLISGWTIFIGGRSIGQTD
jgi:hypothetical protein